MKLAGNSLKKAAPWVAGAVGGFFLLANLAGAVYVERLMSRPRRKRNRSSDLSDFVPDVKYDTAECRFTCDDDVELSSLLLTPEKTNGHVVLVCHGLAHNKHSGIRFIQYLLREGYTLLGN